MQRGETVYGTDLEVENIGLSSERVQGFATSIYKEFERMITHYDEDVVKELLPLVVTILEHLDHSMSNSNEYAVEIELLKDDKEQLKTQFERERQLRRLAEQRQMESEDAVELATRDYKQRAETLEGVTRQLEMRCKNHIDQVERLQEREMELKKEYNELHQRHTEMIQSYVEHIEKTKVLQQHPAPEPPRSVKTKKERARVPEAISPLTPNMPYPIGTASLKQSTPQMQNDHIRGQPSTPDFDRSHTSLKDEMPQPPANNANVEDSVVKGSHVCSPEVDENGLSEQNSVQEAVESTPGSVDVSNENGDWVSSEVKEILELGPDFNQGFLEPPNTNTDSSNNAEADESQESTGIENEAFEHEAKVNEDSLFAEMSQQDLGDVDDGANILGMGKEVENLIHENTKLLATKNALNVVKDDLIHQVDQLTTQLSMLQEELEKSQESKESLQKRISGLETDLNVTRKKMEELENNSSNPASKISEEEEAKPLSQRKRFTRVEMARVLMERNQYKERLMELQEAVRWTEMLRASRDHPDLNQQKNKNKSSIFQFFSRLFNSGSSVNNDATPSVPPSRSFGNAQRMSAGGSSDINISYNASNSKVLPKSRSTIGSMYGRSPTIEAVQDTTSLKHEPRGISEASASGDPGRMQACGWSLPGAGAIQHEKSRTVPVPVYCIPLTDTNDNAKLWCAAAVNISIGKTRDGGSIVGTGSVFYSQMSGTSAGNGAEDTSTGGSSQSSVDKLHEELESQKRDMEKEASRREALSSLVWLVSSDFRSGESSTSRTKVRVIDARDPSRCLESFFVGSGDANILCMTSVPGIQEEDYSNSESVETTAQPPLSPRKNMDSGAKDEGYPGAEGKDAALQAPANDSDPLGVGHNSSASGTAEENDNLSDKLKKSCHVSQEDISVGSPMLGRLHAVQSPANSQNLHPPSKEMTTTQVEMGFTRVDPQLDDVRLSSLQPTMWLGSQNGCVYVHSAVNSWSRCLHQIRLKDSVLAIVHTKGRALTALADGTVAIFRRNNEGVWDLSNYHLLDLGRPLHSVRCMTVVYEKVWCGYRNKIRVIDPKTMQIEKTFNAHPRHESQLRSLAWAGDGVWVSIRLDSTLRLYHARTFQHLQDVDVEPYVSKVLGTGKLGFSFVRITALITSCNRLWIGTGNGVVISVPLSESPVSAVGGHVSSSASTAAVSSKHSGPGNVVRVYSDPVSEKVTPGTYIPYCSMANAQLSFHGHRDAVKFFVAVPGCVTQAKGSSDNDKSTYPAFNVASNNTYASSLVMSGGEGYIDFRLCDGGTSPQQESKLQAHSNPDVSGVGTQNRSHIIVWQLTPQLLQ